MCTKLCVCVCVNVTVDMLMILYMERLEDNFGNSFHLVESSFVYVILYIRFRLFVP